MTEMQIIDHYKKYECNMDVMLSLHLGSFLQFHKKIREIKWRLNMNIYLASHFDPDFRNWSMIVMIATYYCVCPASPEIIWG